MIPFPESLKLLFTATKGFFSFWILADEIWVCDDLIIIFVHNCNDESQEKYSISFNDCMTGFY